MEGLICLGGGGGEGGAYMQVKKATEKTDIMRQNENLYLKTLRKCIVLFIVLLIKKLESRHSYKMAYAKRSLHEGGLYME